MMGAINIACQQINDLTRYKIKTKSSGFICKIRHGRTYACAKTLPGNAHSLGALIDHLEWDEIIGTICGDDTCLIICRTPDDTGVVSDRFLNML